MKRQFHGSFARCAGVLAGSAALVAGGAAYAAEAAAAADGAGLEEVVVTAQKRETSLQKTPIAISVMGSAELANRHVLSLEDLGDGSIPSLRVAPFFARNSALTLGMRGIGALGDANQPARDQAVGVYIDGVYLGRAQGLGAAMYDVERIEVLKGPQGTLFGCNTEGGAISIVTKAPTGKFDMDTTVGYGNYNGYKAQTHIDLPSFHDVSIKFDGLITKRDGTIANPTSSGQPDFNAYEKRGFQVEALWRPTDSFSATYAFDDSYDGTTPYYVQLLTKSAYYGLAPLIHLQASRADTANVGVPLQLSVGKTSGHRLNLNWKLSDRLEIKSVSSYRSLTQSQYDNGEENLSVYAPNGAFSRYSLAHVYQNQYSEELQVLGHFKQVEVVGGAFYYHEWVRDNAQTPNTLQWNATGTAYTNLSVDLSKVSYDRASHVTTESYGAFGQAVWTPPIFNEIAHLTVGGRMTHDGKVGSLDIVNGALPSYVDASHNIITGIIPLDKSWDHFDPLINLAIDVTPDVIVYGKWSTGYKAGGANSRSLIYRAFDPETVSMFEVGAKTEFWDRRARLNIAAYNGELKDAQVDFTVTITNNNRGTLETTNAATGTTRGVDLDFTVNPIEGLTLTASYAYTKISLSKAFNPITGAMSVVYPLYTPKNAAGFGVDYQRPVMGVTVSGHLDGNYADGQYTSTTDPTVSDASSHGDLRVKVGVQLINHLLRLFGIRWSEPLF
ncbi:MAG: TonB-dependent receptor [Caulobacteraceae bacterium]|nr:TonB-dependent receptor [Caulobacteraceae bacterium]